MDEYTKICMKEFTSRSNLEHVVLMSNASQDVRNDAAVELATLRDQLTQAQAERDALKEANTHGDELLKTAKDLFDGTHELCDEVDSEEWLWKWRVRYYLGETDIPVHEMPQDMK